MFHSSSIVLGMQIEHTSNTFMQWPSHREGPFMENSKSACRLIVF